MSRLAGALLGLIFGAAVGWLAGRLPGTVWVGIGGAYKPRSGDLGGPHG